MRGAPSAAAPRDIVRFVGGIVVLGLGLVVSYFGYEWGDVTLNPNELLGPLLFWGALVYLLLTIPLRVVVRSFWGYVRRPLDAAVFVAYMAIHLVLYGFLLEAILSTVYGTSLLSVTSGFLISTNVFYPPSVSSAALDLAYNPSIYATVSPVFSVALSFYSLSAALVIAILVVVSIGKTREIGRLST
jgi:hypothetical protein